MVGRWRWLTRLTRLTAAGRNGLPMLQRNINQSLTSD